MLDLIKQFCRKLFIKKDFGLTWLEVSKMMENRDHEFRSRIRANFEGSAKVQNTPGVSHLARLQEISPHLFNQICLQMLQANQHGHASNAALLTASIKAANQDQG